MEVEVDKPKMCGTCGARDAPLKCPCKAVFYCNTKCQRESWEGHRGECTVDPERKLRKLLKDQRRLEGNDPAILLALVDLGGLYKRQDRLGEAREKYLEFLEIIGSRQGERREIVAVVSSLLGDIYKE